MRTLLSQVETKYLILEKVLFQSIDEYQEAQKLLDANRTQAWVNCPRRQMAFFQSIKEHFPSSDTIEYNVSGTEWGLACNAIHFIDNLAMYSGCLDYDMDISELEEYSHASKRDGYIEFYGTLKGEFQNGHRFILTCTKGNNVSLVTSISNANTSIRYESGAHTAQLTTGNVNQEIEHELTPQSQLTDKIAMQILATGASELPEFSESTKLHLPLINAFLAHINQSSSQIHTKVPIT